MDLMPWRITSNAKGLRDKSFPLLYDDLEDRATRVRTTTSAKVVMEPTVVEDNDSNQH